MAKPKDTKIEQCLRRLVREAVKKEEAITVKLARSRAEVELKLDVGFLKDDEEWKTRSKSIIQDAFQDSDVSAPETPKAKAVKQRLPTEKGREKAEAQKIGAKATREPEWSSKSRQTAKATEEEGRDREDERVDDSDGSGDSSEDDESEGHHSRVGAQPENPIPKRPANAVPKVNGVKRKIGAKSSSETDSDSEAEDDSETEEPRQKKAKADSVSNSQGSSSSESEQSEDEQRQRRSKPTSSSKAPASPSSGTLLVTAKPPKPFRPPAGYSALDSGLLTSSSAFSQESLNGKQLWHITAPSGIPLSSISEIAIDAIQTGSPVLTHKGADYTLNEDRTISDDTATILLPTAKGYERIEKKVARSLHLQQKIILPHLTKHQASQVTGSSAAADVAEAAVSNVRPQPKGLRMRYRPPGFGAGKPGRIGSESENEEQSDGGRDGAAFQFPRTLGVHGTGFEEGRVDSGMAGVDVDLDADAGFEESGRGVKRKEEEKKRKKKKKERKEKEKEKESGQGKLSPGHNESKVNDMSKASVSSASPPPPPPPPPPPSAQKRQSFSPEVRSKKASKTDAAEMHNSVKPGEALTKKEKARLKDEKRRRKEEKRESKEAKRKAKEAAASS